MIRVLVFFCLFARELRNFESSGKSFDSFFVNQILLSFLKNAGEVIKILYVRTVFDGDLQVFKLFLYL